jgi:predicted MPP superfamily phosphohydrolase
MIQKIQTYITYFMIALLLGVAHSFAQLRVNLPNAYMPYKTKDIIAIGDIHGDCDGLIDILLKHKLIYNSQRPLRWTGKDIILVQVGDLVDRGECDMTVIDTFIELKQDIFFNNKPGEVYVINGNHELRNVIEKAEDDISIGALYEFANWLEKEIATPRNQQLFVLSHFPNSSRREKRQLTEAISETLNNLWEELLEVDRVFEKLAEEAKGKKGRELLGDEFKKTSDMPRALRKALKVRNECFQPGGYCNLIMATFNTVMVIGNTLFVHGGLEDNYMNLDWHQYNRDVSNYMLGLTDPPRGLFNDKGPLWSRKFSERNEDGNCKELRRVLNHIGAKRMVVGHTPQPKGVNNACGKHIRDKGSHRLFSPDRNSLNFYHLENDEIDGVWRVDTGMSPYYSRKKYDNEGEVLLITNQGKSTAVLK